MDKLQEIIEFPVTIPNQKKPYQLIQISSIINVITSLIVGVITDSIKNICISFIIQFIILLLIVSPNWLFQSEPSLEWLTVKF
ncbi:conserved hypothetical protein [Candida dubliniensis CD36]|uniref:Signal peptidase complex subunit n=1 Tax=Candida dubliniensis (strain CD36 / ATCC MYA-646 / CBS 7987 / NCPF 3949 / NRRL Y-17841) TaxID=573826 RepID=B9WGJ7_CANDC|nr:conserved hypothetical protein [Candida dubliniensis CD36]CAX42371.1 conserved hypothetical protein [Candida dubliniensis CD36]